MKDELPGITQSRTVEGLSGKNELLYVVFRFGIYRHQCGGVFDCKELAISAAKELKEAELDDHHSFEVVPFELNKKTIRPDNQGNYGWLLEHDRIFNV